MGDGCNFGSITPLTGHHQQDYSRLVFLSPSFSAPVATFICTKAVKLISNAHGPLLVGLKCYIVVIQRHFIIILISSIH